MATETKKIEQEDEWLEATGGAIAFVKEPVGTAYIGILKSVEDVDSKFGKSRKYTLTQDDGNTISIWGFSALNYLMNNVGLGSYVKMVYTGVEKGIKTKFGTKDIHTARVYTKAIPLVQVQAKKVAEDDDLPF